MKGYKLLYERTENPLFAWTAYYRCRSVREEIPDWVLECFDRAAHNLVGLCRVESIRKEVGPAVAEALEITGPMFKKAGDTSDVKMAIDAVSRMLDGQKRGLAIEPVAEDHDLNKSTVRRAVEKYFPGWPSDRNRGLQLLKDRSNLDMALDVASYIEDGHERGLPIESLAGMAFEYVAVNHNVSELTVARAFEKYFPKKEYWTKLPNSK